MKNIRFIIVKMLCLMTMIAVSPKLMADQPETTIVEMTDTVLVKDTVRFGINLGGDTYYSGAVLTQKRAQENFEGTTYRQCHFGPSQDENGATSWFRQPQGWQDRQAQARYRSLPMGPDENRRTGTSMETIR